MLPEPFLGPKYGFWSPSLGTCSYRGGLREEDLLISDLWEPDLRDPDPRYLRP